MAKALLHHPKQSNKIVLQHIPFLTDDVSLVDLLENISWTLLQLMNVDHGFCNGDQCLGKKIVVVLLLTTL